MASQRFTSFLATAFLVVSLVACGGEGGGPGEPGGPGGAGGTAGGTTGTAGNAMPDAASNETQAGANSEAARVLVGHWRTTTIVFENPRDENIMFHADGTYENWIVTAVDRSQTTTGAWRVEGISLVIRPAGEEEIAGPYTFFDGQLVYPNIPDRRLFWERIGE